jgi:hypothetical protein
MSNILHAYTGLPARNIDVPAPDELRDRGFAGEILVAETKRHFKPAASSTPTIPK